MKNVLSYLLVLFLIGLPVYGQGQIPSNGGGGSGLAKPVTTTYTTTGTYNLTSTPGAYNVRVFDGSSGASFTAVLPDATTCAGAVEVITKLPSYNPPNGGTFGFLQIQCFSGQNISGRGGYAANIFVANTKTYVSTGTQWIQCGNTITNPTNTSNAVGGVVGIDPFDEMTMLGGGLACKQVDRQAALAGGSTFNLGQGGSNTTPFGYSPYQVGDATAGNINYTLPGPNEASLPDGTAFVFKRKDSSANTFTITAENGSTIDGAATKTITTQYGTLRIVWDKTNATWWVF